VRFQAHGLQKGLQQLFMMELLENMTQKLTELEQQEEKKQ
jgi:hypothetical protein